MLKSTELAELFETAKRNPEREVWTSSNASAEWRGNARVHFVFLGRLYVVVPSGCDAGGVGNYQPTNHGEAFAVSAFESFLDRGRCALREYVATGHSHHLDAARNHAAVVHALSAAV